MLWIYDLPLWLLCVGTMAVVVTLSAIGLLVTQTLLRRFVQPRDNEDHNGHVTTFFGASVGLVSITLGLLAVAVWENFAEVSSTTNAEAGDIAALYYDVNAYPEPVAAQLRESLRDYTRYVIDDAWPLQRKGIIPQAGNVRLENIHQIQTSFQPETAAQDAIHGEALAAFNDLVQTRRGRLVSVTSGLPGTVWAVVLLGVAFSISSTWFFRMRSGRLHLLLTSSFAAMLGVLIFFIAAMDHPFRGDFSIGPDAYELTYETVLMGDETAHTDPAIVAALAGDGVPDLAARTSPDGAESAPGAPATVPR